MDDHNDDDDEFVPRGGTEFFYKIGQLQVTWKLVAICKDSKVHIFQPVTAVVSRNLKDSGNRG